MFSLNQTSKMEVTDILDDLNLSFSDNFSFKYIPGIQRSSAPPTLGAKPTMPKAHPSAKTKEEENESEEDALNLSESLLLEDTYYRESVDPFRSEFPMPTSRKVCEILCLF